MPDFIDLFFKLLAMFKPTKRSIICGDINIDLLKFNSISCIERYVNDLSNMNFTPFSVLPTHCVNNSFTIIDHVFSTFGSDCF